ncbi:MAG TPA: glycosyltransferase family 4 protein [Bacilli bacterium]
MNILIIAPEEIPVPPFAGGSVENCIINIAKRLAAKHKVTIVSRRHKRYPNYKKTGNLTMIRTPSGSAQQYIKHVMHKLKGNTYDFIQIDNRPRFVSVVRQYYPNTPISIFLHSLTFVSNPRISTVEARRHLSKANLIIANSQSLANEVKHKFPMLKHKIKHVLLGVDLKQFRPPTNEQRHNIRNLHRLGRTFTIVYAGRLIPKKGIPVLIQAAKIVHKSIPATRLVIAGSIGGKAYKQKLRRLAANSRVPTKFLGRVNLNRMHQVYWMGDCFVCPSQSSEPFGLVNVEAMASGTPAVASRNGGIPEIIRHNRNGLLVRQYRNPQAFAGQILKIAKNRRAAAQLAKQARIEMIRKFSWQQTASKLSEIYSARSSTK